MTVIESYTEGNRSVACMVEPLPDGRWKGSVVIGTRAGPKAEAAMSTFGTAPCDTESDARIWVQAWAHRYYPPDATAEH